MLLRLLPVSLLGLLLVPALALASEDGEGHKEYVTEFFIVLIVLIMALFAVIAGFEARKARRQSS